MFAKLYFLDHLKCIDIICLTTKTASKWIHAVYRVSRVGRVGDLERTAIRARAMLNGAPRFDTFVVQFTQVRVTTSEESL